MVPHALPETSASPARTSEIRGHLSPTPSYTADSLSSVTRTRSLYQSVVLLGLVVEAMARLALFDLLSRRGFDRVHAFTRSRRVAGRAPAGGTTPRVCDAVAEACAWYFKRAYCLQRSTVATWMLRRRGIPASLVIAYRPAPVDSHAWVEVDGQVVNDLPQYQKHYKVLDRL